MGGDRELLEAWRGGDEVAGEELFERYYEPVLRFFRNKLTEGVADLVQQTFMACVEGRDRIREGGDFRSYLFSVAHNLLRSHLRKRYRAGQEVDFWEQSIQALAPGPVTIVVQRGEERVLLEALRSIPVEHQVLLELRYWEHLKTAEIAEILAIPHATLRTRLRRAHQLLEQALADLAESKELLTSTLADLDGWAAQCRARMGGTRSVQSPPASR